MQTPVQAEFPAVLGSLTPLAGWLEARSASRTFSVRFDIRDSDVCIVFTDAGDAFPLARLEAARRDRFCEISPLLESGRGLMLILLSVDRFSVERAAGENIATLEKKISV